MSNVHNRPIAKEIVEQVKKHFKKQREEAIKKQSEQKSKEKYELKTERYEPSAEFHSVFKGIMGETKRKEEKFNKSTQPSVFKRFSQRKIKKEKTKHNPSSNEKKLQKTAKSDKTEDNTNKSDQPSVFERLSHRTNEKKHS